MYTDAPLICLYFYFQYNLLGGLIVLGLTVLESSLFAFDHQHNLMCKAKRQYNDSIFKPNARIL